MITVRLDAARITSPAEHKEADGFFFDDGILYILQGNDRLAAYPAHLVLSVTKTDCPCHTDVIAEKTAAAGVTVDGVLLKHGSIVK